MARGSKSQKEPEEETNMVAACAGVVAFIGVVTILLGIFALHSKSLDVVDNLVRMNSDSTEGSMPTFTTKRVYMILMGFGLAVIIAALVGIFGHKNRTKPAISCYLIFTCIVAFIMLLATFQLYQRNTSVVVIVDRQAGEYCDRTTYNRQMTNLGCFNKTGMLSPPLECNGACQGRSATLSKINGCKLLPDMCDKFEYTKSTAPATDCAFLLANSYTTPLKDLTACEAACDAFFWCTGYVALTTNAAGTCTINASTSPTTWTTRGLTPIPPGLAGLLWTQQAAPDFATSPAYGCYTKGKVSVLPRFHSFARKGLFTVLILSIALMVSMVCTCYNLYNVNISRPGKLGCGALAMTIFCPCAAAAPDDHLGNLVEEGPE